MYSAEYICDKFYWVTELGTNCRLYDNSEAKTLEKLKKPKNFHSLPEKLNDLYSQTFNILRNDFRNKLQEFPQQQEQYY